MPESLFNKVAGLRPKHRYFPVSFAKFLGTPFLQNTHFRATASVFIFLKI